MPNPNVDEQKLVELYMDLTGSTESKARSVFMYVCPNSAASSDGQTSLEIEPAAELGSASRTKSLANQAAKPVVAILALLSWCCTARSAQPATGPATNTFLASPLSLADSVNIALQQNPSVLKAQKDVEATQGVVIQTRAIALPNFGFNGSYGAVARTDIDILQTPGFTFGTPQNWTTQVKLVQSFYQGGRMLSAFRIAKLTTQQSLLNYQTVLADTVLSVQLAYYAVLLAAQQITVQEASVELLTQELTDTSRRYEAGTVPRFNVLRAEVELANARPKLISARNSFRISKNALANLLGFNLPQGTSEDIPLTLAGKLEAEALDIDLSRAVAVALEKRPELSSLQKAQALRKEDVVNAKAGYKPILQGYVGYEIHNSSLSSDLSVENHGWIAGAQATWNLFDGLRTRGRVKEATANYEKAGVELDDAQRRIELEVRTAYSTFIESREVLESQKKVLEQAEEALRLASARYDAGSGTQLDVLSAQTALTDARSTQIQALHDYEAARARLQRAVGMNLPAEPTHP